MTGYVLDWTVLAAFAQGDDHVANTIASLDEAHTRLAVPVLALIQAQSGLPDDQVAIAAGLVNNLPSIELDPISDTDVARETARVASWITDPPNLAAAQTIAVAMRLEWNVLTVDVKAWDLVNAQLPREVPVITIAEPPEI
ncbi:hypothetical protein FEK35_27110 [Nocardia cyriacigeorgica]|uniref:PIN domain-containing protein n=1 Tax=Nocardia cyriacigeorgica TaxID=135487 RepID=A0A5R8P7C9_9NOCA|nr:hypothetical protein [Nocardia cyriacigeorgica]TLF97577.1 hypothetical protein FEK35_27110 [Nocardia cyriacigeorgica]